jgi:anthranilate synthase component 2
VRRAGPLLFIESGDSFSWNVVETLPFARERIQLISAADRAGIERALPFASALVLGPGPTDPLRAGLVAYVHAAAALGLPLLGICLGHQALGVAFGATLRRVPPCHGELDRALFEGSRCFPGCAPEQTVMRYHSLALDDVRPPLRVVARNPAGLVMAIEHQALPMAGLQFHPDSYASPNGRALVASFFEGLA